MPDLDAILARLASPELAPGARRIAILDLIRLTPTEPRATQALLAHLPSETDEKSALAIIRHLAAVGHQPARATLWHLYQNQSTSVRIAHAAIVAHDSLLALDAASPRDPLECERGQHTNDDSSS